MDKPVQKAIMTGYQVLVIINLSRLAWLSPIAYKKAEKFKRKVFYPKNKRQFLNYSNRNWRLFVLWNFLTCWNPEDYYECKTLSAKQLNLFSINKKILHITDSQSKWLALLLYWDLKSAQCVIYQ